MADPEPVSNCEQCGVLIYNVELQCSGCGDERMSLEQFRLQQDWTCALCQQTNDGVRRTCFVCQRARMSISTWRDFLGMVPCKICREFNLPSIQNCVECGQDMRTVKHEELSVEKDLSQIPDFTPTTFRPKRKHEESSSNSVSTTSISSTAKSGNLQKSLYPLISDQSVPVASPLRSAHTVADGFPNDLNSLSPQVATHQHLDIPEPTVKRARGRLLGSKNKPKVVEGNRPATSSPFQIEPSEQSKSPSTKPVTTSNVTQELSVPASPIPNTKPQIKPSSAPATSTLSKPRARIRANEQLTELIRGMYPKFQLDITIAQTGIVVGRKGDDLYVGSPDGDDELDHVVAISRWSSVDRDWSNNDNIKAIKRVQDLRDLCVTMHQNDHGDACTIDPESIPSTFIVLYDVSSNNNLATMGGAIMHSFRRQLRLLKTTGPDKNVTLIISQWDGISTHMYGLADLLEDVSGANWMMIIYKRDGLSEMVSIPAFIAEIRKIQLGTSNLNPTNEQQVVKEVALTMGAVGHNKLGISQLTTANKQLGVGRNRNGTELYDARLPARSNEIPAHVQSLDEREELISQNRKKVATVHLQRTSDGLLLCPLPGLPHHHSNLQQVIEHVTDHTWSTIEDSKRSCPLCPKSFQTEGNKKQKAAVRKHVQSHLTATMYKCELTLQCGKLFTTPEHLRRHQIESHLNNDKERHKCTRCSESFSRHQQLLRHMEMHELHDAEEAGEALPAALEAKRDLVVKQKQRAHQQYAGRRKDMIQCPYCPVVLEHRWLREHINTEHVEGENISDFIEKAGFPTDGRPLDDVHVKSVMSGGAASQPAVQPTLDSFLSDAGFGNEYSFAPIYSSDILSRVGTTTGSRQTPALPLTIETMFDLPVDE